MNDRKVTMTMLLLAWLALAAMPAFSDELDDRLGAAKKQGMPVLLEFGAEWCIPCQQMKPVMKKIGERYQGKLSIIVIDMDRSREQAARYHIRFVPTLVFLDKSGVEFKRLFGGSSYDEIVEVLKTQGL